MKTFNTFKFRCHNFGTLTTKAKTGNGLSETAKDELINIYAETLTGVKTQFNSKYTEKGIICEDAAIALLGDVFGEFFVKNEKQAEDDYNVGTCDILTKNYVIDVKCSWNINTFLKAEFTRMYAWQLYLYKSIYRVEHAYLAYVLMPTPVELLEKYKASEDEINESLYYQSMPANERVKIMKLDYTLLGEEPSKRRRDVVELCREYLEIINNNRILSAKNLITWQQ